jgi:sigma-B regulation protein RsbU (phosphoserine phosphatase)
MDKFLENAPCGFLMFLDDSTIVQVNERLKDMLEYESVESLKGLSINAILTVPSRIFYNTHFFPLIRMHGEAHEIFFSLLTRTNKDIPVLTNAVRTEENGRWINQCVFMPVHQRKKYEGEIINAKRAAEEALKKNKTLTKLVGELEARTSQLDTQYSRLLAMNQDLRQFNKIISHDLQEPIRKIQIFSDILSRELERQGGEKARSMMKKIMSSTEKLKSLTVGLEQYIKVDSEELYSTVDLNEVLDSARKRAAEDNNFSGFEVTSDILPAVEGYQVQLELLFYHLLINAIQNCAGDRKLMIRVSSVILQENIYRATEGKYRYTQHVRIHVEDNGMGFDNQYNEYVFNALSKINPQTEGLGIGLSLCKKIADNHMGSISVKSQVGKGSTFSIMLPRTHHASLQN